MTLFSKMWPHWISTVHDKLHANARYWQQKQQGMCLCVGLCVYVYVCVCCDCVCVCVRVRREGYRFWILVTDKQQAIADLMLPLHFLLGRQIWSVWKVEAGVWGENNWSIPSGSRWFSWRRYSYKYYSDSNNNQHCDFCPQIMYHKFLGCPGAFGKVYRGKFWSDTKPPASKQVAIKTLKSKSSHAYIHQYKVELAHMCRCESRVCCFVNIRICLECSCPKSVAQHMMTTLYMWRMFYEYLHTHKNESCALCPYFTCCCLLQTLPFVFNLLAW